jgi:hypothetical protein
MHTHITRIIYKTFFVVATCSVLAASESPITSSKNYTLLGTFIGAELPAASFSIWVPVTAKHDYNRAKSIALQAPDAREKSTRISPELYKELCDYRQVLSLHLDHLTEQRNHLTHHPLDRKAVLTRREEMQRYTKIIAAYQTALMLLHTIKAPTATPSGGSPITERFASDF